MSCKILVVEDDANIAKYIQACLELGSYESEICGDGLRAVERISGGGYDLVLLDVMLPGLDGFQVMERVKDSGVPVLYLTAVQDVANKVRGLKSGAEDYIVKPFAMEELLARVQVVLRRFHKEQNRFHIRDVDIDLASGSVKRGEVSVELTHREYELLKVLLLNKNIALSRERLLELAWGMDFYGDDRTVDVHIRRLRQKLGLEAEIRTIFRYGYRLEV